MLVSSLDQLRQPQAWISYHACAQLTPAHGNGLAAFMGFGQFPGAQERPSCHQVTDPRCREPEIGYTGDLEEIRGVTGCHPDLTDPAVHAEAPLCLSHQHPGRAASVAHLRRNKAPTRALRQLGSEPVSGTGRYGLQGGLYRTRGRHVRMVMLVHGCMIVRCVERALHYRHADKPARSPTLPAYRRTGVPADMPREVKNELSREQPPGRTCCGSRRTVSSPSILALHGK